MKNLRHVLLRYGSWVLVVFLVFITSCEEKVSIRTLDSRNGYAFELYTQAFIELAAPVYCRVKMDGSLIFPFVTIGYTSEYPYDLEFTLIDHGVLVAIVEQSTPHVVLAIYDFVSQVSWSWQEEPKVGKRLLERLQEKHPNFPFILSTEFGGNAKIK